MSSSPLENKFNEFWASQDIFSASTLYQGIGALSFLIAIFSALAFSGHYFPRLSAFTNVMSFMKDPLMSGSICATSSLIAVGAYLFQSWQKKQALEELEKACGSEIITNLEMQKTEAQKETTNAEKDEKTLTDAFTKKQEIEAVRAILNSKRSQIKALRAKLGNTQEAANALLGRLEKELEEIKTSAAKAEEEKIALEKAHRRQNAKEKLEKAKQEVLAKAEQLKQQKK